MVQIRGRKKILLLIERKKLIDIIAEENDPAFVQIRRRKMILLLIERKKLNDMMAEENDPALAEVMNLLVVEPANRFACWSAWT